MQQPQATQLVISGADVLKNGIPPFHPVCLSLSMDRAGQMNVQMSHFWHFTLSKERSAVLMSDGRL
jgi:hypothetical protein